MFYRDYKAGEIEAAVDLDLEHHISSSEGVRHLLTYANGTEPAMTPLASWSSLPAPDISVYGQLGGVQ
jgi:hypothetical protein